MARTNQASLRVPSPQEVRKVTRRIAKLSELGGRTIKQLAEEQLGIHTAGQDIGLLRLQLIYRLQTKAYGGLRPATQRRLRQIYNRIRLDEAYAPKPHYGLAVGTILERDWCGVTHQVAVTDDGFEYRSMRFGTLSEVAQRITGTRWSGPLFFGLRKGGQK